MMQAYKKGQGKYTRTLTVICATFLAVVSAVALSGFLLSGSYGGVYLGYGIPTLLVLVVGFGTYWLVNRPGTADFLIATEGEMKKVSWSSRKEVVGSTKVVIITTFVLAMVLFAVDMAFVLLFQTIRVT
jgi:preprotein translocase subunit SecE